MEQKPMMTAESLKSFNRWRWGVALGLLALLVLLPLFTSIGPNSWRQCAEREGLSGAKSTAAATSTGTGSVDVADKAVVAVPPAGATASVPVGAAPVDAGAAVTGSGASVPVGPVASGRSPESGIKVGGVPAGVRMYFSTGGTKPRGSPQAKLADIVAYLNNNPNAKVIVQGFHDPRGDVRYNSRLALKRAGSVERILKRLGISAERIIVNPDGNVLGSGSPAEARRVDVTVAG